MTELRTDRIFAAPPERAWRALTDPDALARWFWPPTMHTTVTVDLCPGDALHRLAFT